MFKHVCLVRKATEDDGTWHYELDSLLSVDWDAFAAEKVKARLQDRAIDPAFHVIQREYGMMKTRQNLVPEIEGMIVYDTPTMLTREQLEFYIRFTSVMEIRNQFVKSG